MADVAPFDPFQALGLERDATAQSIKSKYHELARLYHPNRGQGTDDSKTALSEYFHHVHKAWDLLSEPEKRRRYVEILNLYDLRETILAGVSDLSSATEHSEHRHEHHTPSFDGHVSSDGDDEDVPHIAGIARRQTFEQTRNPPAHLEDVEEDDDPDQSSKDRTPKSRVSQLSRRVDSGRDSDGSDKNVAAERRKKYDRLRREELDAFNSYRDAMIARFEAEERAEACKELYETAAWRRQYFERAPKETSQRMRLLRLFNIATKAFTAQQQPVKRGKGLSVSADGQALSTGDPFPTTQYLSLPTRTKSLRRQKYSNDISVDQTSSDEDYSSDRSTSPRRHARPSSPSPNHHRHRSGDFIPIALNTGHRRLHNADHDPISPITGPGPRVVVRTATSLHEMLDRTGSDDESLPLSRVTSPRMGNPGQGRFEVLPHMSMSELFGSDANERGRHVSAERRSSHTNGQPTSAHHAHIDPFLFEVKQVGQHQHSHILIENVHELRGQEKQSILGVPPDTDNTPLELLNALAKLDENVAKRFMVKPDIKREFRFRLIYNHREVARQQHQSFIALSYRRKLHVEKHSTHYTLPLEPEMFQAVWDERQSDKEGVWIDQICIDQDSEDEKTTSMSAMDMVYRSARLVVVALDDIKLEAHEATILEDHMEAFEGQQLHVPPNKRFRRRQPPWLEGHDELYRVIGKLLSSSWFRRAWCRHEMRLARHHIFLVPCRNPGSWSGRSVVRFSGSCLTHLLGLATEVAFEPAIEAVKPALYAFFRDRSKLSPEGNLRSHHGNFTTVIAEVFAMEAGGDPRIPPEQREADARKDQIAIVLNTLECGLALHHRVRKAGVNFSLIECNYMLLLLALAARDPGALCSVGHSFGDLPYGLRSTWMLLPTSVDSGLNNYRTLDRLPGRYRVTTHITGHEHFVELDLKFLTPGKVLKAADVPENMNLARKFLQVCEERQLGRNRKRYLLKDRNANHLFGSVWDVYAETLSNLLECGPDWMSDVCQRYGVSRWKYDLKPAYELLIAFKNTNGNWPEHAWSQKGAAFLMDFVNFLVIRGMPQRQLMQPQAWRPICVRTPDGGRVLTFVPPGEIRVAMPAALMDADYLHLARLWIMEPRDEFNPDTVPHHNEWTLRGKSVLFTDETALQLLEADNGKIRRGQRVFGRSAASI